MNAFAVFACPPSMRIFSTKSWICSTEGMLLSSLKKTSRTAAIWFEICSASALSLPPTDCAAFQIASVIFSCEKSAMWPSRFLIFFIGDMVR